LLAARYSCRAFHFHERPIPFQDSLHCRVIVFICLQLTCFDKSPLAPSIFRRPATPSQHIFIIIHRAYELVGFHFFREQTSLFLRSKWWKSWTTLMSQQKNLSCACRSLWIYTVLRFMEYFARCWILRKVFLVPASVISRVSQMNNCTSWGDWATVLSY